MDLEKEPINPENETNDSQIQYYNENKLDTELEASTIFAKNTSLEKPIKVVSGKKKRARLLIVLSTVALIAIGGLLAVSYLIPDEEEAGESASTTIKVKSILADDISKIEISNSYGNLVFTSKVIEGEDTASSSSTTVEWSLEGYDASLIASSSISSAADSLATFYATREMTDRTLDYGFNEPTVTATVTLRSGEGYTVTVGRMSPDSSGYYLKVSGDEKIYLVSSGTVDNYNTTPEKLANQVIVNTPVLGDDTKTADKKYFDDEGNLAAFDSIALSGPKYGKAVTLLPLEDNEMAKYVIDMGSYTRYADTDAVTEMFGIMTNGLVAIETYKLNPTAADIAKYGLGSPEVSIRLKYGSGETALVASMYDTENEYYAVMVEGLDGIYAVTADALSMLELGIKDFYNDFVFLEYLRDFSGIEVVTAEKTYNFGITYDEEEEEISATESGKSVDSELMSAYYQHFTTVMPEEMDSYASGETAFKAVFTYADSSKGSRTFELVKQSERRYLVKIDGIEMGLVNSTVYDHLVVYAQYVLDGKGIPEP